MKNSVVIVMVSVLALSACRTTEGYRQRLSNYMGASETQLIDAWGVPNDTYDLEGGVKVLQYNQMVQSYTTTPSYGTSFYSGRRYGHGSGLYHSAYVPLSPPPTVVTSSCQTLFKLDRKKRVFDFGFRGNACLAEESEGTQ